MESLATKSTKGTTRKRSSSRSHSPANTTRKSARSRNVSPKILSSMDGGDSAVDYSFESSNNGGGSRSSSPVPPDGSKRSQSPVNVPTEGTNNKAIPFGSTKPFSMFDTSSIVKKRKRRLQMALEERGEELKLPLHVCGLPIPEEVLGVCAKCKSDRDSDTILLCDGEGCEKEYHMACCTPPLDKVPTSEFYCFDCSVKGTTGELEEYLEEQDSKKSELDDPNSFVETLLWQDVWNELNPKQTLEETEPTEFPRSELDGLHQEDPQSFIGKAIRLYCPKGNHYHNGRIVDVRSPHPNDTDCLVRFHAGSDGRKTALQTWICLEEHCVAVCTDILWARFGNRIWKKARLWSRSSRELVPVMRDLIRDGGAWSPFIQSESSSPHRPSKVSKPNFGLVESMIGDGDATYEYLELKKNTNSQELRGNAKTPTGREAQLMHGLVQLELDQQERVKRWHKLPLKNPMHPKAISIQDEYGLGTLEYQVPRPTLIQPPSLIPQGLDRSYLMERIASLRHCKPSKDMAASLDCLLVDRPALSIQEITAMHRAKLCGDSKSEGVATAAVKRDDMKTEPNRTA